MNNRIIRTISFFLIVLLLLSGCVNPGGTMEPGKTTEHGQTMEPGKPSSDSSSHPGKDDSKSVIRTLADQRSEWTEGQYYPGAYGKTSSTFRFPAESSTYVFEANGIVYAYSNPFNSENTGRMHVIRKTDGTKEEDIFLTEIPENYRLYQMYGAADTLYLLARENEATPDVQNLELFIYSTAGEFRLRKKLTELLNSTDTQNSLIGAFADQDGNLWAYLPEEKTLTCIGPDGKTSRTVELPKDSEYGYMRGRAVDELTTVQKTETGLVLGKMNTKTGKFSKQYPIEDLPGLQKWFAGTTYDALITTEKSLYGVTLQEGVLVKELLAFEDLGIDRSILQSIEDHEDGSISMLLLARGKTEGERIVLTPSRTKVRNGLTLACLKSNDYLVYAVGQYNQEHPDDKITIKQYYDKYAVDASEADAMNRLNSDLMDGTAGDIVCLDGISFAGGGKALLDKGIFVDLYELMDNDPEFHKEDYFTDIFRVNETDGKLYRLVPFFTLNTKYGRVDDVGETTHLDESLLFETDPVTNLFGPLYRRTEFIHDLLVFSLGDAQDRDAVLYNTDQMVHYIEVAGKLPEFKFYQGGDYSEEYKDFDEAVSRWYSDLFSGATLFYKDPYYTMNAYFWEVRFASAYLGKPVDRNQWSGMTWEEKTEAYHKAGVRLAFSGFPVKDGCGSAVINLFSLAIPSQTDRVGDAWAFLKQSLSESCQSIKRLSQEAVSINKASFEQFVQRLFSYQSIDDDPSYLQFFIVEVGESEPKEEVRYLTPTLQQWMVDEFLELLGDISIVDEVDRNVEVIVTEEIEKYCDGRQTAEEAARNIAERVELYRDEQ